MKQIMLIPALMLAVLSGSVSMNRFSPLSVNVDSGKQGQLRTITSCKWYLATLYNDQGYTQLLDRRVHLSIQSAKNSAGGNAGCNSYGANVSINDNSISFSQIFSTRMYCEEMQEVENKYLAGLRQVNRFELKGKKLLMYVGDKLLLEFESAEY